MKDDHFIDPLLHLMLLVTGVIFLADSLCLLPSSMPLAGWFIRALAHGRFPELWASSSLLAYMLRTTGILYAWLGASFLLAANDPGRYRSWARLSGVLLLVMAATCAISGLIYHLPRVIYMGDGISAAIGGFPLVRFGRIRRPSPNRGATPGSGT